MIMLIQNVFVKIIPMLLTNMNDNMYELRSIKEKFEEQLELHFKEILQNIIKQTW
jgi:hypothetical protein